MSTVKVKEFTYRDGTVNRYVEATLDLSITASLEDGDLRNEIPMEEAKKLMDRSLDHYAGSNDGSEMLANADYHFEQ